MSYNSNAAINAYTQVKNGGAEYANPHQLICMLYDGALQRMGQILTAMREKDFQRKATLMAQTIDIVDALADCLDKKQGGELAENLEALYGYIGRRLVDASISNETAPVEECMRLLSEVSDAWSQIPEEYRNKRNIQPATTTE